MAIKKLAESVTTVKNVLDRKITDESRKVIIFFFLSYISFDHPHKVSGLFRHKGIIDAYSSLDNDWLPVNPYSDLILGTFLPLAWQNSVL